MNPESYNILFFLCLLGLVKYSGGLLVFVPNIWTRFVDDRGKRKSVMDIQKVSLLSRVLIAARTTSAGEPKNKGQRRLRAVLA